MNYNNPNDVLNLAQRIYMKQPNLGTINTDKLLFELSNIANQSFTQPGLDIQGIDDISKARALQHLLGKPSLNYRNFNPMTNELGIKMYQDLNKYSYSPEDDNFYSDPNKYFYAEDILNTPYIPKSALFETNEISNDLFPIEIRTVRPHLNTALGKWYLMNGGKI